MDVLIITPDTTYQRSFSRCDQSSAGSQLCIKVQEGPVGGELEVCEHHLVCLRQILKVRSSGCLLDTVLGYCLT